MNPAFGSILNPPSNTNQFWGKSVSAWSFTQYSNRIVINSTNGPANALMFSLPFNVRGFNNVRFTGTITADLHLLFRISPNFNFNIKEDDGRYLPTGTYTDALASIQPDSYYSQWGVAKYWNTNNNVYLCLMSNSTNTSVTIYDLSLA